MQADRVFVRFWNSRAVQPQPFRCFDSSAEAGLVHCIPAWQMAWAQLVEGLMLLLLRVMGIPVFAGYLLW